jgi:hypothetical protein
MSCDKIRRITLICKIAEPDKKKAGFYARLLPNQLFVNQIQIYEKIYIAKINVFSVNKYKAMLIRVKH